jgi:hypothetical protein
MKALVTLAAISLGMLTFSAVAKADGYRTGHYYGGGSRYSNSFNHYGGGWSHGGGHYGGGRGYGGGYGYGGGRGYGRGYGYGGGYRGVGRVQYRQRYGGQYMPYVPPFYRDGFTFYPPGTNYIYPR